MMVAEQHRPAIDRLAVAVGLPRTPIDELGARLATSEDVCASIERILQKLQYRIINRNHPPCLATELTIVNRGQRELLASKPQQHLSCTADLHEFLEYKMNRLLNSLVGLELDLGMMRPAESDRQCIFKLTAIRFGANRLQ